MTEVGIKSYPLEDVYLILSELDDPQAAINADAPQGMYLQVLIKPLVSWIWFGCLILVAGTIIALWPSVDRRKLLEEVPGEAVPEPVGATD
jgi:cytochrome c-type biogenesis protein CcmF